MAKEREREKERGRGRGRERMREKRKEKIYDAKREKGQAEDKRVQKEV
jgi:hypothetical protein